MKEVLPPPTTGGGDVPTGFESIGHIAHVNLRDEYVPFAPLIGRIILDKNPSLRCVVNKTAVIETVFRTFPMDVIAGEDDTRVSVRHSGATFRFDFRTVYWNTRLQYEHTLAVDHLVPTASPTAPAAAPSIVADVFCGVGPFAVPLAMPPRGCTVWANDLNPASHAALVENVARNHVASRVSCFNEDGRAFIARVGASGVPCSDALMNLPADGLAFTDAFVGFFRRGATAARVLAASAGAAAVAAAAVVGAPHTINAGVGGCDAEEDADAATRQLPRLHVYCFARADSDEDAADDAVRRLLATLRLSMPSETAIARAGSAMTTAAAAAAAASDASVGSALTPPPPPSWLSASGRGSTLTQVTTPLICAVRCGDRCEEEGGSHLPAITDLLVRSIRNVAPGKVMLCVSFMLPRQVARATPVWKWAPDVGGVGAPAATVEGAQQGRKRARAQAGGE